MAVTNIPNVQNWTVTPQNGQSGYFDLMNTWLGQSTLVIASLQSAITAQNAANAEINTLASQVSQDTNTTVTAKDEAVTALALLSSGSINDTTIGVDKAYSNSKVNSIIKKRKNYLINGNFQFWDYATSQTAIGYGSDNRWLNNNIGSTKTHSRMTSGDTERALFESPYYSRTTVSSVTGIGNYTNKFQRIEDITKLAGKTVTLSFWAKANSSKNITIEFGQEFGTGGTPSASVSNVGTSTISLNTVWQKKTITVTMPSIIGKTLGTDGVHTTNTYLLFWFDAGSNYNSRTNNLGQQSGTFDIAEVKLEDGSIATDGWSPYDGEWGSEAIARQRYCEIGYYQQYRYVVNAGVYNMSSLYFKVTKRIIPTMSIIGGVGYQGVAVSGSLVNEPNVNYSYIQINSTSAGEAGVNFTYTVSAEI